MDTPVPNASPFTQKLLQSMDADPGFCGAAISRATVVDLDDDDAQTPRRLASAILRDAALTAQLMRHANASGRAGQSVATIDQAVAVLGMIKIKAITAALAAVDDAPASMSPHIPHSVQSPQFAHTPPSAPALHSAQAELLQAELAAAWFAGLIAAGITRVNAPRLKTQESQVCALLQNLGRIMAIRYLYDDIGRCHALQAEHNLSEDEAVLQTFGVGFDDLGRAVARHWKFPDVLCKSLDAGPDRLPARAAGGTLEWHQYCGGFARRITDAVFRLPAHQQKGAIAAEIAAYRHMLHLKEAEVGELVERALAELDAGIAASGLSSGSARARELLRKSSERVTDWLSPQDSLTRRSADDARKTRVEVIYQLLRSIHDAFHFDMTLLCVPNGASELVAISGVGRNANQIMARFRFGGAKADLFRSVAAKAVGLYVADVQGGPYAKFIPPWYDGLVGAKSLYLMSLMHEGEPLGLVYGDFTLAKEQPPEGLDGAQMRQWRNALIAALRQPSRRV